MRMLQGQVPVATALQQPFQGKHILQGLCARPLTARVADAGHENLPVLSLVGLRKRGSALLTKRLTRFELKLS